MKKTINELKNMITETKINSYNDGFNDGYKKHQKESKNENVILWIVIILAYLTIIFTDIKL